MYKIYTSEKIVLEDTIIPGGILVNRFGKIEDILSRKRLQSFKNLENYQIIDVNPGFLMAGLVDSHVHINEPGRTEWEGFETATKAAAAGGFTTIVDMPLNSIPPTTSVENLEIKKAAAIDKVHVDVAFWGGIVPGNQNELIPLVNAGVKAFKCFMCPSGVDEFGHVDLKQVEIAMQVLKNTDAVIAFHAEIDCCNNNGVIRGDPTKYQTFLDSRPQQMELNAIEGIISLAETYKVKTHVVHLSSAKALDIIKEAKARDLALTVETCHHYLNLSSENIPDKATEFKCCPPVRDSRNKDLLWRGLKEGAIDMVVSDHSPSTPDLKLLNPQDANFGDFCKAWGGIASLQFGLSLFWNEAKDRGFTIFAINKFMSRATSELVGLHKVKGRLAVNYDADFIVWNPESHIKIDVTYIQHKNKITPYLGRELCGKVLKTILRGEIIYDETSKFGERRGELIKLL